MRAFIGLLLVGASTLAVQTASAATVVDVQGPVLVNHGPGFVPASAGTRVDGGDKVMARVRASAAIQYDDGCKVTVAPGATVIVALVSPCKAALIAPAEDPFGLSPPLIVGGVVVGAAIIATIVILSDASDNPASP